MGVTAYSALQAKTAAMRAKHLSAAQYDELKGKTSVSEAVAYLKYNTVYAPLLEHVSERTVPRRFGAAVRQLFAVRGAKALQFCSDSKKQILSYTYVRYEIGILKAYFTCAVCG